MTRETSAPVPERELRVVTDTMAAIPPFADRVLKGEQVRYERLADFEGLGRRWLSWRYTPTYGTAGELDGWVAIGTDIHDRKLAQVFATLLKNAAKHTHARGSISFTAALDGREAVVSVEDSGVGLEPGVASRLFKSAPSFGAAPGSDGEAGIGLTLVQGIVALHRGTVEARSAGLGRGSEFVVRLPLAPEAPGAAAAQARADYTASSQSPVRVLVADDNRDAADSLQRVLALFGHEVRVAYDGASALQLCEQFKPRVAVLDIAMPSPNGYDVARAMRKQQGECAILVAVTGWGQEADRQRAMEAGFDYHLTKPVDPSALNKLLVAAASS